MTREGMWCRGLIRVALLGWAWASLALAQPPVPATLRSAPADPLLVFCALAEGNWDLYMWDLRPTHPPSRLTRTPYDEMSPSLAPDHSHVIYQTADGRLWRLDLRPGADPRPLPYGSDQRLDMHPAIAPDSVRVALATSLDRSTDDTDLIVYNQALNTFGPRLQMISYQHYPAWSPDGKWLAFSNLHARSQTGAFISEIWMMRADGQGMRQLSLLDGYSISPRWLPSGREIVFASSARGSFDIWKVDVSSREPRRLTDDPAADTNPVCSPDGKSILFVSDRDGSLALWELREGSDRPRPVMPFGSGQHRPCKDPDCK